MGDKLAVFQVMGVDPNRGGESRVLYASLSEEERDCFFENDPRKEYYSKIDRVISMAELGYELMNKLDGNDLLVLQTCLLFDFTSESLSAPIGDRNYTFWEPENY